MSKHLTDIRPYIVIIVVSVDGDSAITTNFFNPPCLKESGAHAVTG